MAEHAKSIVFVHGGHFKPESARLKTIWRDALRWGIERDYVDKVLAFDAVNTRFAYFGDLTNGFLQSKGLRYDEHLDVADRMNALGKLKAINKRKKFKRQEYGQLPGKTASKEFLADVASPVLGGLGLGKPAISKLAPELNEYWNDADFARSIRDRVRAVLTETMKSSADIMLIAHCTGALVAYDVLWELSRSMPHNKINMLVTMGCPLGDHTVQKKLAGRELSGADRYPSNILAWDNVSAEDDYVCHDKTVADDFRPMLKNHLISSISDFRIYNLAVRYGTSNPHSSVGYLIHPRVSKLVADWL